MALRWQLNDALEKIEELRVDCCETLQDCDAQIVTAWNQKEKGIAFEKERVANEYNVLRARYNDAVQKIFNLAAEIDKLTLNN